MKRQLDDVASLVSKNLDVNSTLALKLVSKKLKESVDVTKKELQNAHMKQMLQALNDKVRQYTNIPFNNNDVYANRHPMYTCHTDMKEYIQRNNIKAKINNTKQLMKNSMKKDGNYLNGRKAYDNMIRQLDLQFINFACPRPYIF